MGMPTDEDECPDHYYCEQCRPEDHKELLDGIARGEKPWEDRQAQHQREEEEAKAKKRKGGKRGRKSKAELEAAATTASTNNTPVKTQPPATESKADTTKRKASDLAVDTTAAEKVRGNTICATRANMSQNTTKSRKTSTPQDPKSAKSRGSGPASATTPLRRDSKVTIQAELVENIADLHNPIRQRAAKALDKLFGESIEAAKKDKSFKQRSGQSDSELGLRIALSVEYALYLNLWGNSEEPSPSYGAQLRTILHNVKANHRLRDRLLNSQLSANELSQMSSFDMASKEKQEEAQKIMKDAERQHTLIEEPGPRFRRTHKGDELIENDAQNAPAATSIYTNAPMRAPDREGDKEKEASPTRGPDSPNAVELPEDLTKPSTRPLTVDTKAKTKKGPERKSSANFNIDNVWSSIDSPNAMTKQPPTPSSALSRGPTSGVQADPEIDHLLKDEEDEEPYSPMDYEMEPGTVWRGILCMPMIAEFRGSAKFVAGKDLSDVHPWSQLMPSMLSIEGRIDVERAGSYLCGLQWSKTTDVCVVSITPAESPADEAQFDKLFAYFTERRRYGVVGKVPVSLVRDVYVIPLEAGSTPKPDFLELLLHCDVPSERPKRMLLLTYVVKVRTDNAPTPGSATQPAQPGRQVDGNAASPNAGSHYRTPSIPQTLMSPVNPQSGIPGQAGSPAGLPQPFSPLQGQPPNSPPDQLRGHAAAQHVLGSLYQSPVVPQLLQQAPNTGEVEFTVVKEAMQHDPETRNDLSRLMSALQTRLAARR
jgi:SPOC domain/Transcription factor S-II (TFIIS), central domain